MKIFVWAIFAVALVSGPAMACDDHHGQCDIEVWTWHGTPPYLTIEGVATCDEGWAKIRLYDGDKFIGIADGLIEGHALQAYHLNIPSTPENLVIRYSIELR